MGKRRSRMPVAATSAFTSAGGAAVLPVSPIPPGGSPLRMRYKGETALQLRNHHIGIHDNAGIERRDNALHAHLAVLIDARLRIKRANFFD
jgi:hypothetical protein